MENFTSSSRIQPEQRISSAKKTAKWGERNVLSIKAMASSTNNQVRSSRENKEENYDLVNSRFREEDFDYILNPYGINVDKYGGTATKMQDYNIIRSRLETLRGEEMNASLNFFVYAIAGEAVSAKKAKRKEFLIDLMKANIRMEMQLDDSIAQLEQAMAQLQEQMQSAQDQAQLQQMQQQMQELQQQRNSMPDIVAEMKLFNSQYRDPVEDTNNKILEFLKKNDNLAMKFNQGWFHALVSAEEVYYTGILKGHPSARPVNPLHLDYDKGSDTTFIHEGSWVREEFWLPVSEFISMYGDQLSDKQVRILDNGNFSTSYVAGGMEEGFVYDHDGGQRPRYNENGSGTHVYVMRCAWRSYKKVGVLSYPDPRTGKMEEVEVDDTFKLTDELKASGASVVWGWDDDIWEGLLFGQDEVVYARPKNNQTGNLPYVGYVYNNVNSISTSMVDLVKAHQYTYIIVWWRLEQELAKAKGRKFIMDMAQLPSSMGWDVDKWMYYFENMGVVWINSREEGRKGDPSTQANFNQFQSIDMTLSQVVQQYMQVLDKLEYLVEDIMGVSPQRMGGIKASETATGAQTAISRSTNVTKPWFYFHDLVKEAVLTEMLELAKIAYIDGRDLELFLNERDIATLTITGDDINSSDMAVFVTNSYEDRLKRDKMEDLLTTAVNQGQAKLTDLAKSIESESMSYTVSLLDASEKEAAERQAASEQANNETQMSIEKSRREDEEINRAHEIDLQRMKDQTDITIEKMKIGASGAGQGDEGSGDMEALAKYSLDERKVELDELKEQNRSSEKQRELDIKDKQVTAQAKKAASPTSKKS